MTRIEFKFKIPYVVFWEIPFQTNTRLSLKKKKNKKKETQYHIKISNHLFTEQKKPKKKKLKTLKPKTSFPIKIHTRLDYRFFSVPSNTQIGLELQQKP